MKKKLSDWGMIIKLWIKKKKAKKEKVITLHPHSAKRGNVLVSYITSPFIGHNAELSYNHSNQWECHKIVDLFLAAGYEVDIIDFNNSTFVPKKSYSYLFDIHNNLERLSPLINNNCIKILHITGSHWLFQNTAEYSRLLDIQQKRKTTLIPRRIALPSFGIEHCDFASIIGNQYTKDTFNYSNKPIYNIPISATKQFDFNHDKDFEKCKTTFLWFGGSGLVLKGLDLALEAFVEMPEYTLIVCGPINAENDFTLLYENELYNTPNIETKGWIDLSEKSFTEITDRCIGLIYPSFSEGSAGSVIQCLHFGLVPIISNQSGVNTADFGIKLKENTVEEIKKAVHLIATTPAIELKDKANKAWTYAREYHTRDNFEKEYRYFLENIVHIL